MIVLLYAVAMRTVFRYEASHPAAGEQARARRANSRCGRRSQRYALAALVVVAAGIWLPYLGKALAAQMGWSQSFVGTLFVAAATSLPEVAVSVAALRIGALDMAIGNLFGSNLFNIFILAIDDALYLQGPAAVGRIDRACGIGAVGDHDDRGRDRGAAVPPEAARVQDRGLGQHRAVRVLSCSTPISSICMTDTLFAGETALVTGAGNGIGRALALGLAREGARLLLAEIDPARGAAALAAVKEAGGAAELAQVDLSRRGAAEALVDEAVRRLGRVDMLVHSASPPRREADTLMTVSDETWDAMHEVNLRSGFVLARGLARHMIEAKIRGRMLLLTSLHSGTPRNLPHYATAKAGMLMLVKELAKALGAHGIRVNALTPGAVAAGGFVPDAGLAAKIPLGRLAAADDIAAMGLAVLSERFGRYVTGRRHRGRRRARAAQLVRARGALIHMAERNDWHALEGAQALAELASARGGLSVAEAKARLELHGPNRLPPPSRRGPLMRFLAQFHNVLIYVLIASAAITAALGHWVDAGVIAGVIVINAIVGFIQEGKAEEALAAIRKMLSLSALVLRGGERLSLPAEQLVPGDVVLLASGDKVPADLRLLEARNLRIDEAMLTGESEPAEKSVAPVDAGARAGRPQLPRLLRHAGDLRPGDRRGGRHRRADRDRAHQRAARDGRADLDPAHAPARGVRALAHGSRSCCSPAPPSRSATGCAASARPTCSSPRSASRWRRSRRRCRRS